MSTEHGIVIVGGGLAGARAAEGIRDAGYAGPVTLIAAEEALPYVRPPLSKEYLAGTGERSALDVFAADWYVDRRVELARGVRVAALDTAAHRVGFADGTSRSYDRLLLATGAVPRHWRGPGGDLDGVHVLRTIADSERLRAALEPGGRRVAIIGAGWIGLEVAAAARGYGNEVVVVAPEPVPLAAAIGETAGAVFARLHRDHGVELRMATGVAGIVGVGGRATAVETAEGERIACDLVVVGIGAAPETGLAEAAGIAVDNGIVTDAGFRTSADDVYAVGDVASVWHPFLGAHLRVEHWANAENAGRAAGRSIAGEAVEFDEIPYFYTDQYDLGMEYSGFGPLAAGVDPVFRGNVDAREFVAFWLADGRVVAGMNVNVWDVNAQVQELIRSRGVVDVARLTDPAVPLDRVLAEASA